MDERQVYIETLWIQITEKANLIINRQSGKRICYHYVVIFLIRLGPHTHKHKKTYIELCCLFLKLITVADNGIVVWIANKS